MTTTTAEERLCSRGWRLLHSWWLLVPIVSLGLLNFLPFLVNGIRARRRNWLILSGVFLAFVVVWSIVTSGVDTGTKAHPKNSWVGALEVGNWIAGIVAMLVTNRARLRWRAAKDSRPWYQSGVTPSAPVPAPADISRSDIDGLLLGTAPSASPGTRVDALKVAPTPEQSVDLNRASSKELMSALHLSAETAGRIEAARTRLGGFRSPDQLMTEASLPPHVFAAIRDRVSVPSPAESSAPQPGAAGRRLEF